MFSSNLPLGLWNVEKAFGSLENFEARLEMTVALLPVTCCYPFLPGMALQRAFSALGRGWGGGGCVGVAQRHPARILAKLGSRGPDLKWVYSLNSHHPCQHDTGTVWWQGILLFQNLLSVVTSSLEPSLICSLSRQFFIQITGQGRVAPADL